MPGNTNDDEEEEGRCSVLIKSNYILHCAAIHFNWPRDWIRHFPPVFSGHSELDIVCCTWKNVRGTEIAPGD